MAELPETPEFKKLWSQCADTQISSSRILLVCAPSPDAVFASAILGRAIIRSNRFLHITFTEPLIDADMAKSIIAQYPGFQPIFVGVSLQTLESSSLPIDAYFIAPLKEIEGSACIGVAQSSIPPAVVLTDEQLQITASDMRLAAIGTLLSSPRPIKESLSIALVEAAKAFYRISERPEYLLYGANFMAARECFSVSIYPYIEGLSGDSAECDTLLERAEISLPRRSHPLTTLQKAEKQHITSALLERIDPALVAQIIGPNFENLAEKKDSPMRWVSNIRVLSAITWAHREFGTGLSVWMGDRARSLKSLLDLCMDVINQVIVTLHETLPIINEGEFQTTGSATHIALSGGDCAVLTEVGRILMERNSIPSRFLILQNEQLLSLSWPPSEISLVDAIFALRASGLAPLSTSYSSVILSPAPDLQTILTALETIEVVSDT